MGRGSKSAYRLAIYKIECKIYSSSSSRKSISLQQWNRISSFVLGTRSQFVLKMESVGFRELIGCDTGDTLFLDGSLIVAMTLYRNALFRTARKIDHGIVF